MKPLLHYFNPGHETAVLVGSVNYTPPAKIQLMIRELACLPVWYADSSDYVFTEEIDSPCFLGRMPKELKSFATLVSRKEIEEKGDALPEMQAAPWGLSPQSRHLFEKLKEDSNLNLLLPQWKEAYFDLTGRQTAAQCLELIRELLPDMQLPFTPKFCTRISDVEQYLFLQNAPFVVKTPYSSSGRGLLWLPDRKLIAKDKAWIEGAMAKQGAVSIECALNKYQDFAMEFYSDGQGTVRYEGLSVFGAGRKGAYTGSVLGDEEYLNSFFIEHFGKETFDRIKEAVRNAVQRLYGSEYTGYLGVDMLVYRRADDSFAIHPCIEINMRFTMGLVALRISQRYLSPRARGDMHITYESKPGEAYAQHSFMKKAYPLRMKDGKIKEGYLSLCPVTKESRYRAYILVF